MKQTHTITPQTPIQYLKGVGPKLAKVFQKKSVSTAWDMLYYLPIRYIDRREISSINNLKVGQQESFVAQILDYQKVNSRKRRKGILEIVVKDKMDHAIITLFQFNERYIKQKFKPGTNVLFFGEVRLYRGLKNMVHPEMEIWDAGELEKGSGRIMPVYSLTEGLYQKTLRNIIQKNLETMLDMVEDEPRSVRDSKEVGLSLVLALKELHEPGLNVNLAQLNQRKSLQHQRVIYDEFFYLQLALLAKQHVNASQNALVVSSKDMGLMTKSMQNLNFELTDDQKITLDDIINDFKKSNPMNRMLQGDVGSGKTIVAFLSALPMVAAGHQVAFMAPTEILAEQHFKNLSKLAEPLGVNVALLTGATKTKERKEIHHDLQTGHINILIGTHALITPEVCFRQLGYVIIDEQHRFGVMQRAKLKQKTSLFCGEEMVPHLLVMTATPIPRTLSMCVYGDLDISIIREMPKGRLPVFTRVYRDNKRCEMYEFIRGELKKGRQAYFVYPLIEESEKSDLKDATLMHQKLSQVFSEFKVGLLHGKMKANEKEKIMELFKTKKYHVLVSTTVVEVGVDVANATVMVVEHAERFGLSQLHQLRGRVGRGAEKSYCFLMASYAQSDESKFRLHVMEKTNDGFEIAEEDLKIRGPGEFLGTRQSGMPDFRLAEIVRDGHLLAAAKKRANEIIKEDPGLNLSKNQRMKKIMNERWGDRLELTRV